MIILYLNKDVKAYNPARVLIISLMILTFAAVFFTGCDENGGITIPSGTTELTLSAKSDESLANPPAVIITEVKALIHQVQLEQETNQNNQTITFEPFVVNFIINGNLKEMTTKYIIRDFYTKVKFQLHKPEDNEVPPDPEFVSGTQKFSFIVKGTYNGSSFVYRSKRTSYVVVNFENTANINLTTMNVTVLFNEHGWFKNGSVDLDPRVAANETLIDENIKNSFKKAFLDNDKNGLPD